MNPYQSQPRTSGEIKARIMRASNEKKHLSDSSKEDSEVDLAWGVIRKAIFDLGCWCRHCANRERACRCDGIRRNALAFLQDRPWDNRGELIPSALEFWCHIAQIPTLLIKEFFSDANAEEWIRLTLEYRAPYRRQRGGKHVPIEATKLELWRAFGRDRPACRPGLQILRTDQTAETTGAPE